MTQSIRGIFTGFMLAHDPTARAATISVTPWRGTMRRMVTAMSMLVVFAATAGVASATDESKFNSLIGKNAVDPADVSADKFSPKAGCACQGGTLANWPGVLVRTSESPGPTIYCMVVTFFNGSLAGSALCADFVVLTK